MRTAFLKILEDLAEGDHRINLVVGDLGFGVVERFAERFPNQFLNAGVAEQNMIGIAAGMAISGKAVFAYSIANFSTLRCLEQIRNDVCYHNANVKVVSVGGGLSYGALGSSHHATEDLAILRSLPGIIVVAPGDPVETEHAVRAIAGQEGPAYLRLGKAGEPIVHQKPIEFRLGRALRVTEGTDLTIFSTGAMLHSCKAASEILQACGISTRLLSMHTIKPIDEESICRAALETSAIMTVEEHSIVGGLGSAVSEVLVQKGQRKVPFKIMGLQDRFCSIVGSQDYLRSAYGLSVENIVKNAKDLLGETGGSRSDAKLSSNGTGFARNSLQESASSKQNRQF